MEESVDRHGGAEDGEGTDAGDGHGASAAGGGMGSTGHGPTMPDPR